MVNPAYDGDPEQLLQPLHPRGTGGAVDYEKAKTNPNPWFQPDLPGLPLPPMFPNPFKDGVVDDAAVEKALPAGGRDVHREDVLARALAKYDTSSLEEAKGDSDNWIEGVGGSLPSFVRAVAHALIRSGHPKGQAIGMAIGTIKRWSAGGGNVKADTRAKAAKTVAEWDALKAKAAAK